MYTLHTLTLITTHTIHTDTHTVSSYVLVHKLKHRHTQTTHTLTMHTLHRDTHSQHCSDCSLSLCTLSLLSHTATAQFTQLSHRHARATATRIQACPHLSDRSHTQRGYAHTHTEVMAHTGYGRMHQLLHPHEEGCASQSWCMLLPIPIVIGVLQFCWCHWTAP